MAGIISFGAYIPAHRLSRALIAENWETGGLPGERAVANYDEDSLTMAVAAARKCMHQVAPKKIDALYFATTPPPIMKNKVPH